MTFYFNGLFSARFDSRKSSNGVDQNVQLTNRSFFSIAAYFKKFRRHMHQVILARQDK
jgi:hypothetical protein